MSQKQILWIDDQIEGYSEFVSGFESYDLKVFQANTVEEAVRILSKERVDLILLDLKMPGQNGFEFLKKRKIRLNIPICVFSSYLHLKEYQKKLGRLKYNLAVLDKDLPRPESEAFVVLIEKIKRLIATPPSLAPMAYERNVKHKLMKLDPFELEFSRYLAMPNKIKSWLRSKAREEVKDLLEISFKEGYDWVLFCGDKKEIELKSRQGDPPTTNDKIMQIAMDQNRVPYQFSAPDHVDDIYSGNCDGSRNIKNYPTVTLQLEDQKQDFHFDTGSPYTFFSFEELEELGIIDSNALSIDGQRGVFYYEYIQQRVTAKLIDQKTNGVKAVLINAKIIKNWGQSPYVVYCPAKCDATTNTLISPICKNRNGLVGRNLIFENNLSITLCGTSNKSSVKKNKGGKRD